ncbi:FG-GAP-like repeat-containing protein [Streptomyces sp. NPDC052687]|uniref:FG-GAP-like repeat-containing protein n=1 Tax=Streptomyces sp. NPDC052687 TaxID=3154759 RepID=UPI00341E93F5
MARRALGRVATAAAVSFTLAVGLAPLTAGIAHGETVAGEVLVPATTARLPETRLLGAGPSGFLRYEYGRGHVWTTYAGADTVVDGAGTPYDLTAHGVGSDVVARHDASAGTVTLRDMATGASRTVALPAGHRYFTSLGRTVVTLAGTLGTDARWHLLDTREDGSFEDRPVEGVPDGITWTAGASGALGDPRGQVVTYRAGGKAYTSWLDVAQGRLVPLPYTAEHPSGFVLTPTHLLWWEDHGEAAIASRADLTAAPRTLSIPGGDVQLLGMVGDFVVVSRYDESLGGYDVGLPLWRVEAIAADGSTTRTLLDRSFGRGLPTPDGGLLVPGGTDAEDWGVSLIEPAGGGAGGPTVRRIADGTLREQNHTVSQLTLTQGRLNTLEKDPGREWTYLHTREIDVTGSLTPGERTTRGRVIPENYTNERPRLHETGDGRTVVSGHGTTTAQQPHVLGPAQVMPGTRIDTSRVHESVSAAGGRFAALRAPYSGDSAQTSVVDLDTGRTVYTTTEGVAAIWGTTLWLHDGNDSVVPVDLTTGQRGDAVWFGKGCLLNDFQAVGRWLLWTCVGGLEAQGVYDTATRTSRTLVAGSGWEQAQLGDGFVATVRDGQLQVTDVRGQTPVSHTAGKFEWDTWDVDPYTGVIAQHRGDGSVRLTPTGVPVSALAQLDATVAASADVKGGTGQWAPKWWLNKPAASWQLTIRHKATGTAVRTLGGGQARGVVAPSWNGKDDSGRLVPNGTYTWTLTAAPADAHGPALTRSGTLKLSGAAAVARDFAGSDGIGELLTLNGSGGLTYQRGDGTGKFSAKTTGTGWPTTLKAVPYGDLNGDRCNDVLIRLSSGALRAYQPGCGKALTTSTPYTPLGTSGWTQYDILTSPGDLTGDGRADLIARQASTGDVYLFKATSSGTLSARTKLYADWSGYKKIVGAGDLNGDGRGDLLAQDKSNELWRYDGTGTGTFKTRVKVFSDWGASYNAVVGVGDITGDAKPDLVSRDTSGNVWRSTGNGKGSFAARVRIASGWQGYKGLF